MKLFREKEKNPWVDLANVKREYDEDLELSPAVYLDFADGSGQGRVAFILQSPSECPTAQSPDR